MSNDDKDKKATFDEFKENAQKGFESFRKEAKIKLEEAKREIEKCKDTNTRAQANKEYTDALRDPNNWKKVQAEAPVQIETQTNQAPVYAGDRVTAQVVTLPEEARTNHPPVYAGDRVTAQVATLPEEARTNHPPVYAGDRVTAQVATLPEAAQTGDFFAEKIGSNTVTSTRNSITLVDDKGNGCSAKVNEGGTLDYSIVKNNKEEPVPPRDSSALKMIKDLNAIAVTGPDSELKDAAKKSLPIEVTEVMGKSKVISTEHDEKSLESAENRVKNMKTQDQEVGKDLKDRFNSIANGMQAKFDGR